MTTLDAKKTFVHLKYFPRNRNRRVDDGTYVSPNYQPLCVKCGGTVRETISLEFCTECGHVVIDYWGEYNEK